MTGAASLAWFARHELSLSWRDFVAMMTAGRAKRQRAVMIFLVLVVILMHLLAWFALAYPLPGASDQPATTLVVITGLIALAFSLMASQSMESVTRVFYTRSDLDLILSSPAPIRRVFAIRIGAVALSATLLCTLLAAPAVNVLAITESPRWLAAYLAIAALGAIATVFSLSLTILMFRTIGARRTRLIAQIVAAVVGAFFIIGVQLAAIVSIGSMSRIGFLTSEATIAMAPDIDSILFLPARAIMGEFLPLAVLIAIAMAGFTAAIAGFSSGFSEKVLAAAGLAYGQKRVETRRTKFKRRSPGGTLRVKEWKLLLRDHWLISQTLMQVFYLIPPGFMLWKGFGTSGAIATVVVPVLVMAAGQLAGGLAWLAISGEDAPQLVATAPVSRGAIIRAKIEAVLGAVAIVAAPILAILTWASLSVALICAAGMAAASVSATAIQFWFRSQAKRSNFRRRQTSSRVATFAEAFSSIFCAGATALWASDSIFALILVVLALVVLAIARALRPNPSDEFLH